MLLKWILCRSLLASGGYNVVMSAGRSDLYCDRPDSCKILLIFSCNKLLSI